MVTERVPEAPESLKGYGREEWCRIAPELHRLGLLTVIDLQTLATYCHAYCRWRTAEETLTKAAENDPVNHGLVITKPSGNTVLNPLVTAAEKAAGVMLRHAIELGFTPAARSRLHLSGNAEAENKFGPLLLG
jgi:P27 family predicted phage terminase small subunit